MTLMTRQGGVFSTRQATEHGLDRDCIRTLLRQGELRSVRQSIYTRAEMFDEADAPTRHRIQVAAALLARGQCPGSGPPTLVGGHESAAIILGLPVGRAARRAHARQESGEGPGQEHLPAALYPTPMPNAVHLISADRGRRTYRAGVDVCPAALPLTDIAVVAGVPVTTLARTAVDLCRHASWLDAVIIADAALRAGAPRAQVLAVAARCSTWRGGLLANRAAGFADGAAESAAESLVRAALSEFDELPPPELQVEIFDTDGLIGRVDILFLAQWTIVEVDGRIKYTDPHGDPHLVVWREKQREDRLREAGYEVVRVTWDQILANPARVVERILAAFSRAAVRHAAA